MIIDLLLLHLLYSLSNLLSFLLNRYLITIWYRFNPLNREISFDIDVSSVPCGMVGSISLHDMDLDGQQSKLPEENRGRFGPKYGTGYCEATCPRDLHFIDGDANVEGWVPSNVDSNKGTGGKGACCAHVEIFSGNSQATSMAAHPCKTSRMTTCHVTGGTNCGALCDVVGCEFNPYRMSQREFFGPGKVIDTKKKFTVVTQFLTVGTRLSEIKRKYIQGGVTVVNVESRTPKING
jgi:cellulose 1,4-beta-cellobiosidase